MALSQRKNLMKGFLGISFGHRSGRKKYQEGLINWA